MCVCACVFSLSCNVQCLQVCADVITACHTAAQERVAAQEREALRVRRELQQSVEHEKKAMRAAALLDVEMARKRLADDEEKERKRQAALVCLTSNILLFVFLLSLSPPLSPPLSLPQPRRTACGMSPAHQRFNTHWSPLLLHLAEDPARRDPGQ